MAEDFGPFFYLLTSECSLASLPWPSLALSRPLFFSCSLLRAPPSSALGTLIRGGGGLAGWVRAWGWHSLDSHSVTCPLVDEWIYGWMKYLPGPSSQTRLCVCVCLFIDGLCLCHAPFACFVIIHSFLLLSLWRWSLVPSNDRASCPPAMSRDHKFEWSLCFATFILTLHHRRWMMWAGKEGGRETQVCVC